MPHMTVEYSANILDKPDTDVFLKGLHETLVACGPYHLVDIKSRIYACADYRVADCLKNQGFVHLRLDILQGRSEEIRKQTGENLLAYIRKFFAHENCSYSVEVREMEKSTYAKFVSGVM